MESSQTGSSLYTREEHAEQVKMRMLYLLSSLYHNVVNREELMVAEGQFCWFLNVDILVLEELALD